MASCASSSWTRQPSWSSWITRRYISWGCRCESACARHFECGRALICAGFLLPPQMHEAGGLAVSGRKVAIVQDETDGDRDQRQLRA